MNAAFSLDEKLFRAVTLKPIFWNETLQRPSSALFRDSRGVSVNRSFQEGDKAVRHIIKEFKNNLRAVAYVSVQDCLDANVLVLYTPTETNIYHSELHDSVDKVELSRSKAKKLADWCRVWPNRSDDAQN
jgi:hypothetical protein